MCGRQSRIKERTIAEVISSVSLWRLLYTGYENADGTIVKLSLEDAAAKVKISKKSLDDYLMQLRSAKKFGFDFASNSQEKVGKIRSFVREEKMKERKRMAIKQARAIAELKGLTGEHKSDEDMADIENFPIPFLVSRKTATTKKSPQPKSRKQANSFKAK